MKTSVRRMASITTQEDSFYMNNPLPDFYDRIREVTGLTPLVYISQAVWDAFIRPSQELPHPWAEATKKMTAMLLEATNALTKSRLNHAQYEVIMEDQWLMRTFRYDMEVYLDDEELDAPALEIGLLGERFLKLHPDKLEPTDTLPQYKLLHFIKSNN